MTTVHGSNQTESMDLLEAIRRDKGVTTGASASRLANIPTTKPVPQVSEQHRQQVEKAEQFKREREEAQQQSKARQRFDAAQVPARHRQRLDDDTLMEHTPWRVKFGKLADMLGTGFLVVMTGDRGRGKTQMAARLIHAHVYAGGTARYATAMDIFIAVKAGYSNKQSEMDSLKTFLSVDLLVMDEAHERGETEWEQRLLTYLIDCRYRELRDTLLITNQTRADFLTAIGASVASRITETGGVVECDWESFRGKR